MSDTPTEPRGLDTIPVDKRRPVPLGSPMTDLDAAFRLAKNLAVADLMPKDLKNKSSDVLAIMLYGQDLGLTPMQSIQGIYVVKGKPQLSSQTWTALARRAGHKLREIESTDTRCTIEITTKDDPEHPHRETYTIEMAAKAGLVTIKEGGVIWARSQKGERLPWESHTKNMLRNRAISNGAKLACPEVALGFAIEGDYDYIPDVEVEQVEVVPPELHGDTVEAKVAQAQLNDEISQLADQYDFSGMVPATEEEDGPGDEPIEPEPAETYRCELCGAVGQHFEENCPEAGRDA
jgi:hypothetical protein